MLGNKTCLGIDTTGHEIKIVQIRKAGSKYEILQAARIPVDNEDRESALKTFLLETQTSTDNAILTVPGNTCFVKFAQLPDAKPTELIRMARFEAESQIPLPLPDVVWDYDEGVLDQDTNMRNIIIAGTRKAVIDDVVDFADKCGIRSRSILVSPLAGIRSIACSAADSVVVVDIGSEWTDISILLENRLTLSRSVQIGECQLLQAIANDSHIGLDEARRTRLDRGVHTGQNSNDSNGADSNRVEQWFESLSLEIRRSVLSIAASNPNERITKGVIIGECASTPGIVEGIGSRSCLDMQVGNPWEHLLLSPVAAHTAKGHSSTFATATGLALAGLDDAKHIDLKPRDRYREQLLKRRDLAWIWGLSAASMMLASILLLGSPGMTSKSMKLEQIRSDSQRFRKEVQTVEPSVREAASTVKILIDSIETKGASPVEILYQLSLSLPRSVWLTDFSFEAKKNVVLKGSSLSNSSIADAISSITSLGVFKSVDLDYSTLAQKPSGESYDFQITCSWPQDKKAVGPASAGSKTVKTGIVVK